MSWLRAFGLAGALGRLMLPLLLLIFLGGVPFGGGGGELSAAWLLLVLVLVWIGSGVVVKRSGSSLRGGWQRQGVDEAWSASTSEVLGASQPGRSCAMTREG